MLSSRFSFVLAAGLALCARVPTATAGFETAVPGETLAYIGIDDLGGLKKAFGKTAWGKFLGDPAFDSMKAFLGDEIASIGAKAAESTGHNPFDLLDLVDGPAAICLIDAADPDLLKPHADYVPFAVALVLGTGEHGEEFVEKFDAMWEEGLKSGEAIKSAESVGDVEVTVIRSADADSGPPIQLNYGLSGSTFVATLLTEELVDRAYFAQIVDGLNGEAEESLADSDGYASSVAGSAAGGVKMYFDLNTFATRVIAAADAEGEFSDEDKALIDNLGIEDVKTLACTLGFPDGHMASDLQLAWSGQGHLKHIIQTLFTTGAFRTPKLVPAEVLQMNAWHMDIAPTIDAVLALMRDVSPDDAAQAEGMMQMFFQQEDFNVRTDLIDNLGGEFCYFTAKVDEAEALPGSEEDPQNFAAMITLKDGTKFESALDVLVRTQGLHASRKREEFQGVTVYQVPLPFLFVNLHYAVLNDMLVASLSGELLKDVLRRRGDSTLPSLAEKKTYAELVDELAEGPLTSISYQDQADPARTMIEFLRAFAYGEPPPGIPIEVHPPRGEPKFDVPDPELADKYFKGAAVTVSRVADAGFRMRSSDGE